MADDGGYTNITNIDISHVCIKAMTEKYKEKEALKYMQMDAKSMNFPEGSFEVAIDKATFDTVMVIIIVKQCADNSSENAHKLISEVYRVLNPNGLYILVSFGKPEDRLCYLENPKYDWKVTVSKISKPEVKPPVVNEESQ